MPEGDKMDDAEMDRILSKPDEILPSSGFAASVMEAVRREAAAPPPIPFPWKRALPGLAVAAFVLALVVAVGVWTIAQLGRASLAPHLTTPVLTTLPPAWQGAVGSAVAWTVLALLLTFALVKISMRLAVGRV